MRLLSDLTNGWCDSKKQWNNVWWWVKKVTSLSPFPIKKTIKPAKGWMDLDLVYSASSHINICTKYSVLFKSLDIL